MPPNLLILQNPGVVSRNYLLGIQHAAEQLKMPVQVFELGPYWQLDKQQQRLMARRLANLVTRAGITAVISYVCNGLLEFPATNPGYQSLWHELGIPHLMLWTDHPQWYQDRLGLTPALQERFRAANNHHFVKSTAAVWELQHILDWPNVHALCMAEDPTMLTPVTSKQPQYDIVAICGGMPALDSELKTYLDSTDPPDDLLFNLAATKCRRALRSFIDQHHGPKLILHDLFEDLLVWKQANLRHDACRRFAAVTAEHAAAADWLQQQPLRYFEFMRLLHGLTIWQRPFFLHYLARHFRVGMFGGGNDSWVSYIDQPRVYARGRLAINIAQAHDTEGLTHKPYQMAACGAAILHQDSVGLRDCFSPGNNIEVFSTARQAREKAATLLAEPERCRALGQAARQCLEQRHTWAHRLEQMLTTAGCPLSAP